MNVNVFLIQKKKVSIYLYVMLKLPYLLALCNKNRRILSFFSTWMGKRQMYARIKFILHSTLKTFRNNIDIKFE